MAPDASTNPADQFTKFWTDMMAQMGQAAAQGGMPGASSNGRESAPAYTDAAKSMQRAFFDSMARYFDEFMRSEQFLEHMKQTMDQSIAMKKMMDDFLIKAQTSLQAPVRGDVEDLAHLLRGIEERLFDRLDKLEEKVAAVEERHGTGRDARASEASRPTKSSASARNSKKR
ncbi:MAG: hypothetical protein H6819_07435 [Phycisphaerales bacterium]|nr:hypothetical protein [Phycisphaerales bacterium]MCB9857674.1 hypothetical protein [Phycisphaerales bacterium]MCB9864763.1 hypothetical protein [Phycisphaerales bacterium]